MKFRLLPISLVLGVVLPCLLATLGRAVPTPLETTQAIFRRVPCMDEVRYRYHKDTIHALSYTKMRALRAFCSFDSITAEEAIEQLEQLVFSRLTFDQVRLLEFYAELPHVTPDDGRQLLDETTGIEFTAMQAVSALPEIDGLTPEKLLHLVNRVKSLDDDGRWAAKALSSVPGIDGLAVSSGLKLIERMNPEQRMAAEKGCLVDDAAPAAVLEILRLITVLPETEAVNSTGLFTQADMTGEAALFWLRNYFTRPRAEAEGRFYALNDQQKTTLLTAFASGALHLIHKINDLHSVTDQYGAEINNATLAAASRAELMALFNRLHPEAKRRFAETLDRGFTEGKHYLSVGALRQATAFSRRLTASDLSTADIYILMSLGSESYDSSFRDILVPVLSGRIKTLFDGDLLTFLLETDPLNHHVSDFVISCAQKGTLTSFFPEQGARQLKVLDLLAESAFRNEQSLILFSATFNTLLGKLKPTARTYLIRKMLNTIDRPNSAFALQLRVILQYYLSKHPELLSALDQRLITELIERYGAVDLAPYRKTDFIRWKQDGRLAGLSVFQNDDDSRRSYLSNSRHLKANGYLPRLAETLSLLPAHSPINRKAAGLIARERQHPGTMLTALYELSVKAPIIVEWYKKMHGIELSHAVTVYQDDTVQRRLLAAFLQAKMEMFAQRGHSYWREAQLLKPMRHLLESGAISKQDIHSINRFMSIGSCGGLRIYSELNHLFDNTVDIFATVGTGKAIVNDPYNMLLFEIIAASQGQLSWDDVTNRSATVLGTERTSDYLQPGSLPAILHKMMDLREPD